MPDFKVGDRVRIIGEPMDAGAPATIKGMIGTIESVCDFTFFVRMDEGRGWYL